MFLGGGSMLQLTKTPKIIHRFSCPQQIPFRIMLVNARSRPSVNRISCICSKVRCRHFKQLCTKLTDTQEIKLGGGGH